LVSSKFYLKLQMKNEQLKKEAFGFLKGPLMRRPGQDHTILEVEEEEKEEQSNNSSTIALLEKLSTDADLRKKLDKVIHILSSIKEDCS